MTAIGVIVALIVAVVGVAAGYFIGYNNRKKTAEAQIGSAEAEATRLVNEAIKTADQKRKEAVLEAKDEAFRLKAEVDARKVANKIESEREKAVAYHDTVAPKMEEIRYQIDKLELLVADELWIHFCLPWMSFHPFSSFYEFSCFLAVKRRNDSDWCCHNFICL